MLSSTLKTIKKLKPNFANSNKQKISKWWEQIQKWREKKSLDYVNSMKQLNLSMQFKDYMS